MNRPWLSDVVAATGTQDVLGALDALWLLSRRPLPATDLSAVFAPYEQPPEAVEAALYERRDRSGAMANPAPSPVPEAEPAKPKTGPALPLLSRPVPAFVAETEVTEQRPVPTRREEFLEVRLPISLTQPQGLRNATRRTVLCPAPRALSRPRALARALRPLGSTQRMTPGDEEVDETATADATAEQGFPSLVFRCTRTRHRTLDLLVDAGPSMGPWIQSARELHGLIVRECGFREHQVWELYPSADRLVARSGLGGSKGVTRHRRQREWSPLTADRGVTWLRRRPNKGDHVVLLFSDCIGSGWTNQLFPRLARCAAMTSTVGIMNVLPERNWVMTSLAGNSIERIWPKGSSGRRREYTREDPVIPVTPLEPDPLRGFVGALLGQPTGRAFACVFAPSEEPVARPASARPTGEQIVERFLRTASPIARRLALAMAGAPLISPPTLRLVRLSILPDAATSRHEAEVLCSGLLVQVPRHGDVREQQLVSPEELQFDFRPGVRRALLRRGRVGDLSRALHLVASYAEHHFGVLGGVAQMVVSPESIIFGESDGWLALDGALEQVAAGLLMRLGPTNANAAEIAVRRFRSRRAAEGLLDVLDANPWRVTGELPSNWIASLTFMPGRILTALNENPRRPVASVLLTADMPSEWLQAQS